MNDFLKAMEFRHACKIFDETKAIPEEQFRAILEAGRLSPSSMGMEPTRFLVVKDSRLKLELRKVCWDQVQISSAAEVVVLKSLTAQLKPPSSYVEQMSHRRSDTKEGREKWIHFYGKYLESIEAKGESVQNWAKKQAYIAASSMMNCAAFMGIDSCPIEGFVIDDINKLLEIDTFKECVSLVLPFGYRLRAQQPRFRLSMDELVEYR